MICHLGQVIFFLVNQNASGYIRDQCCHLQRDGASLFFLLASAVGSYPKSNKRLYVWLRGLREGGPVEVTMPIYFQRKTFSKLLHCHYFLLLKKRFQHVLDLSFRSMVWDSFCEKIYWASGGSVGSVVTSHTRNTRFENRQRYPWTIFYQLSFGKDLIKRKKEARKCLYLKKLKHFILNWRFYRRADPA